VTEQLASACSCNDEAATVVSSADEDWFQTSPTTVQELLAEQPRSKSIVHAKRMGTLFTACGQPTSAAWVKLWDVPFSTRSPHGRCQTCLEVVTRSKLSRPQQRHQPRTTSEGHQ
jgi:hypothetical protein